MSHQQAIDLPPLPESEFCSWVQDGRVMNAFPWGVGDPAKWDRDGHWSAKRFSREPLFTADQMRAAMRTAILADRSRGAAPVAVPEGFVLVPRDPTEEMWGHLARDIVWFLYSTSAPHRGVKFYKWLENMGREAPAWLRAEIPDVDHSPSKGTWAVCIYKAMLADTPAPLATPLAPAETGLELDAKRYQWLRSGTVERQGRALGDRIHREINRSRYSALLSFRAWCDPEELDAAIDAALAAPPGLAPLVAGVGEVL